MFQIRFEEIHCWYYLWPPHSKSWLTGKDSDAGRDWGAGGEGDDRGWDGWMASLTRWTWVSVNSGSWWWTGRPGVLRFTGLQRVGHDWATDLIWWYIYPFSVLIYLCLKRNPTKVGEKVKTKTKTTTTKTGLLFCFSSFSGIFPLRLFLYF